MFKKVIFSLILLLSSLSLTSQSKVAHIDTYELISNMPEMLEVQKQLEQYSNERMNEIREMRSAVRTKLELYKFEADFCSPTARTHQCTTGRTKCTVDSKACAAGRACCSCIFF